MDMSNTPGIEAEAPRPATRSLADRLDRFSPAFGGIAFLLICGAWLVFFPRTKFSLDQKLWG